jgi:hypothetical protein
VIATSHDHDNAIGPRGPIGTHLYAMSSRPNLTRANAPQTTAMALMGDKTASVFRRYDIMDEADLRDAVSKLASVTTTPEATRTAGSVSVWLMAFTHTSPKVRPRSEPVEVQTR